MNCIVCGKEVLVISRIDDMHSSCLYQYDQSIKKLEEKVEILQRALHEVSCQAVCAGMSVDHKEAIDMLDNCVDIAERAIESVTKEE